MQQVISELERIRRRSRAMLLTQRLAVIVGAAAAVVMGLIAIDFLLRLPGTARLVLLLGGLGVLAWALWTYFRPAVLFRPGLTDLALRAEGIFPALAGRLASSVEFAAEHLDERNQLAARSMAETERRLSGESLARVLSGDRTWRATAALAGVLAVAVTFAIVNPVAAQTGLARLFAPLGATEWPARTGVRSLMHEVLGDARVHPRGQALPLRARVTKGEPDYVAARYRIEVNGRFGPWERIVLTDQGGGVHERLLDTNADRMEYHFETWDYRTPRERITLAAPPAVQRASLTVVPPSYAAAWFSELDVDLGPGLDDRANTENPSLVGSEVTLVLEMNKPLPVPAGEALRDVLGWGLGDLPGLVVDEAAPGTWELRWTLTRTRSLNLRLIDEHGLPNTETIAYRIDAAEDRLPNVTIMKPESDEPVLPTAVVPLTAEARDDVAVATMGLQATVQRQGQQEVTEPEWISTDWSHAPTGRLEAELDLSPLELEEGDTVYVRATAEDVYELDGLRHDPVQSPPRRLQIISDLDLARRFRRELGVVRQNAIRIEARQVELEDDVIAEGPQPGVERGQAQVGERIAAQRAAIDAVRERMQMNRLDDAQLEQLLQRSGDLLDFAGRASNRATGAIEQRQEQMRREGAQAGGRAGDASRPGQQPTEREPGERQPEPAGRPDPAEELDRQEAEAFADISDLDLREPAEEDREIVDAQQEVREELTDLIDLLDRDEDTWVATRRLEELMREQTEVEAETAAVGRRTLGRSQEELTQGERAELERLAEQQSDLAEQSRQLLEDLRRRADELEDVDPQGASAMRSAADRGEQRELSRDMENASQRVEQNQMRTARASQEAARSTLSQMLQDIRETSRANAQELLRRLASLIESIERLIRVQESELTALERAVAAIDGDQAGNGHFAGRDRAMIRLNQNTQSVAGDARAAGQESRRIARLLDRAADAQGSAILALRADPMDVEGAVEAEERSLELLREARTLAEELEQAVEQRELMRQRSELVAAYREQAELQVALRNDTGELAGEVPLDRRGLIEARGLGRRQEEIRTALDDLRATTPEIIESTVFLHVHERMDTWSRDASDALVGGELSGTVLDRQQQIADSIGRLIEALEALIQPPDQFAGGSQGGGAGSGQGQPAPLIPPLAELLLLRGMQEQVYDQTRQLNRRGDLEEGERRSRLSEVGEDQRELLRLGREIAEQLQGPGGPSEAAEGDRP